MKPFYHKNTRLSDFDYNQNGYYFITICTKNLKCILSEVIDNNASFDFSPATNSVSGFITAFKKYTNKEANIKLWQRNFYDHIIRDEPDLRNHIRYINENPKKWLMSKDEYYA